MIEYLLAVAYLGLVCGVTALHRTRALSDRIDLVEQMAHTRDEILGSRIAAVGEPSRHRSYVEARKRGERGDVL